MIRLALQRKDAAAALGVSVDTFDRQVRPYIKCVYIGNRVWPVSELERFLAEAAVTPVVSLQNAKRPRAAGTAGGMAQRSTAS